MSSLDCVERKIIADTRENEETRVAILEGGRLADVFIERMWDRQKAGEIYKARVESVLPGINAAFVTIGEGRNAFLYWNEITSIVSSAGAGDKIKFDVLREQRDRKSVV